MTCKIVSPQQMQQYDAVNLIALPAYRGRMDVLTGHAEAFVLLVEGTITVAHGAGQTEQIPIEGGHCHVKDDDVVIIV